MSISELQYGGGESQSKRRGEEVNAMENVIHLSTEDADELLALLEDLADRKTIIDGGDTVTIEID